MQHGLIGRVSPQAANEKPGPAAGWTCWACAFDTPNAGMVAIAAATAVCCANALRVSLIEEKGFIIGSSLVP